MGGVYFSMSIYKKIIKGLSLTLLTLTCLLCASACGNILNLANYCSEHDWEETQKKATCTRDGLITRVCKVCEYTETETIKASHTFKWIAKKNATCTEDGYSRYQECTVCGEEKDKQVYTKFGHDVAHENSKPATCQNRAYCGVCRQEYGEKSNHIYLKTGVEEVPATCTESGVTAYEYCAYEGCTYETQREEIPALGHDGQRVGQMDDQGNITYINIISHTNCFEGYCGICRQFYEGSGHKIDADGSKLADCENPGYCGKCKKYYGEPLGHILKTVPYKEATCTENGNYEYQTCERSGCKALEEEKNAAIIEKLGHEGIAISLKLPTCTHYGLGAQPSGWGETEYKDVENVCIRCEAPYILEMYECKNTYIEEYGEYSEEIHKAYCQNPACQNTNYTRFLIAPLGHDVYNEENGFKSEYSSQANCYEQAFCGVCKEYYGTVEHGPSTQATCLKKSVCSLCKQEYGNLGSHTVDLPATCTEYATCLVCKESFGELKAHNFTETGTCKGNYCSVCEAYYTGENNEYVNPNNHKYENHECTRCGEDEPQA